MCQLSYEALYLGPEGGRQTKKTIWQEDVTPPQANDALCLNTPKHNGKSGTDQITLMCLSKPVSDVPSAYGIAFCVQ